MKKENSKGWEKIFILFQRTLTSSFITAEKSAILQFTFPLLSVECHSKHWCTFKETVTSKIKYL